MGKEEQFEVLKLKTHLLKVNIHCDGCKLRVKRLLHRIQGVLSVEVDVEKQKVTVQANVDSSTLIKKLRRAGKHAEVWPDKPSNQAKNNGSNKQPKPGGRNEKQNKVPHKPLPPYSSDEDNLDDKEDSDDSEDDMLMLDKILKQGSNHNAKKKKGVNGHANNNATMAALQKMMNGNGNGNGNVARSGFGLQSQVPMPVNYHGQAHHLPAMARGHNMQQQQPQMYLRSPQVAPYTGYYPSPYYYQINQPCNDYVTHLFSDENTRGCVIM